MKRLLRQISAWWLARKKQRACQTIREEFARYGLNLSHLTDQQIEDILSDFRKNIALTGLSMEEASANMRKARAILFPQN